MKSSVQAVAEAGRVDDEGFEPGTMSWRLKESRGCTTVKCLTACEAQSDVLFSVTCSLSPAS